MPEAPLSPDTGTAPTVSFERSAARPPPLPASGAHVAPAAELTAAPTSIANSSTAVPPAAPPASSPEAGASEPAEEQAEPGSPLRFAGLASCSTSCVVHLAILLLLALITLPQLPRYQANLVVEAALGYDEVEFEITPPLEITAAAEAPTTEPFDAAAVLADAGAAEYAPQTNLAAENALLDDAVGGLAADIGALFGEKGQGFARAGDGLGGAEFFGVKAGGTSFAFVVDSSNSMRGGKWEAAKAEVLLAVKRLNRDQKFYVVFFDWDANPMFSKTRPELNPLLATPENISKLEYWVPTVQNELKTRPYEAMKLAHELRPDAIYFLTDGKIHDDTEGFLKRVNITDEPIYGRRPRVMVHTIGFWDPSGQDVLKRIAKDNGGTYRYVPRK